ncbi:hypothetical protein DXB77_07980 [Clostridium sp. OM05-9]|nr:hypothetical protein DXB77_07980 [Clostridium sp. OM05-9]
MLLYTRGKRRNIWKRQNKLRLYEYFNYLLTEIPEHMDDKNNDFCEKLLHWSAELPAECRK